MKKGFSKFDVEMESEEEFQKLFEFLDKNKDNKLDIDEWNSAFNKKSNSFHSLF